MRGVHVYVDVDDVLAETTRAIHALARSAFGSVVTFDDMVDFDLANSLGLDAREHARLWNAIHEEHFLGALDPMPGAVSTLSSWHASGARISVVTGRPPDSRAVTEAWLGRSALPYHRLEMVDKYGRHGEVGGPTLDDLAGRDYSLVVEDAPGMAEFFVERTEAVVLLVDRPWNRSCDVAHERLHRVADWRAIDATCDALAEVIARRAS